MAAEKVVSGRDAAGFFWSREMAKMECVIVQAGGRVFQFWVCLN